MIREALVKARGHRGRAAVLVGCARSTLWRKIKHYGIEV
jgi:transcriptional regulator of acetoin/glycerol metabolism